MSLNIFNDIGHLRYWVDQHNGGIKALWNEVSKLNGQVCEDGKWLKEHIFNSEWGIWSRIDKLEHQVCEPDKWLKEHIFNSEWGIWKRIDALEAENAELKKEVQQLRELAAQLCQLENMLINAVNQQLGDK